MAYGKTIVLLLRDGTGGDTTALANAQNLKWKGIMDSDYGTVPHGAVSTRDLLGEGEHVDGDASGLAALTVADRLYIVGHGTYGHQPELGGRTAGALAQELHDAGLRNVGVVSLVSCNSGWGWGDQVPSAVPRGVSSALQHPFGCLLWEALKAPGIGINTEVRARVGYVTVGKDGHKTVEFTENKWVNKVVWAPKGYNKRSWS